MHQSTSRRAPLMFWDLTHYKLHSNNNCARVMWSQRCSRHAEPRPASHLDGRRGKDLRDWERAGRGEPAVGVEGGGYAASGFAPSARLPDSSAQSPERQRKGGVQGQSISRPQPSFKAAWWENLQARQRSQSPVCETYGVRTD